MASMAGGFPEWGLGFNIFQAGSVTYTYLNKAITHKKCREVAEGVVPDSFSGRSTLSRDR
jgi:hypothetical protein